MGEVPRLCFLDEDPSSALPPSDLFPSPLFPAYFSASCFFLEQVAAALRCHAAVGKAIHKAMGMAL